MGAIKLNYKFFNPLAFYLIYYMGRKDIRRILFYGGSSSGKSYSCAQMLLICARVEGSNSLVLRKTGATIDDSIYKAFKVAADQLGIKNQFLFSQRKIRCLKNDAEIVFKGLDESPSSWRRRPADTCHLESYQGNPLDKAKRDRH